MKPSGCQRRDAAEKAAGTQPGSNKTSCAGFEVVRPMEIHKKKPHRGVRGEPRGVGVSPLESISALFVPRVAGWPFLRGVLQKWRGEGGFVGFPPADENRRQRHSIHRLRGDNPHGTTSTKNPPFIFQSGSRRGRSSFFSGMGTNTRGWGGFLASPGSATSLSLSNPPSAARG